MRKSGRCYPVRLNGRISFTKGLGWVWLGFVLALFALGGASEGVGPVAATTASATRPQSILPSLLNSTSILADFDNDNRPDLAIIRSDGTHYKVDIQLSAQESVSYTIPRSAAGFRAMVFDIDDDGYDDLILFNGTSSQLLGMWLNDGDHSRFESGKDDGPPSNILWGERPWSYRHNPSPEASVFTNPTYRLPFGRPPSEFFRTALGREKSISSEPSEPCLQILSYTLHGRSPPMPSIL